ncbi:MAG: selenocysteine-specific translation elongation factor [Planctomycetota bacterium]
MNANSERIFNIVLGTAGHIDHGKSSLVQRLTGIDPDRLPEERDRGLTIDLGFAPLTLPDGRRVGIVDVPGHERLIKNMVAGATGIDLVLLVVAADDSVMPQTREHLTIMHILGISEGIVAMTKSDLVEDEMRELVREEIQETVEGTFLEGAPIVEVSSITGDGFDKLLETLYEKMANIQPRESSGAFRMPIQRVFSPKGFGTVITGIPVSGQTQIGDTLEITPLGKRGRVRGVQAYKESSDSARAGHSTAINLSDIDYREVHRGMVLAAPGYFSGSKMFEARFRYLPSSRRPLVHQSTIRLHTGTIEVVGKIFLLERKVLEPGEESFVQFRLDEEVVAAPGDRYVLRLHSPMETIGGGEILDRSKWRLKLGKGFILDQLKEKEKALENRLSFLLGILKSGGFTTVTEKDLAVKTGQSLDELRGDLDVLKENGDAVESGRAGQFYASTMLDEATAKTLDIARTYFNEQPRRRLIDKSHVRSQLAGNDVFLQEVLERLSSSGELETTDSGKLCFSGLTPAISETDAQSLDTIRTALNASPFTPPSPDELAQSHGWAPTDGVELFDLLVEEHEAVKVADGIYFHRDALDSAKEKLRAHLEAEGNVTAGDAKSLLESTRKYCIPLLEYLDRTGFTVRKGDTRVLKT